MMYFGHEGTVTFAGMLVEEMKALLEDIRSDWNEYRGG